MMHSYVGEDRGVFGAVMSDIFGFDDLAQAAANAAMDPLAAVNAPLVARAKAALAIYDEYFPLIASISHSETRKGAEDILKTNWHKTGFLGLGGGTNLIELAAKVRSYLAEPYGQFVRFNDKLEVSYARTKRLDAFVEGVNALRKYMERLQIRPTKVVSSTVTVDQSPAALLSQAREALAKARQTRSAVDIGVARVLAQTTFDAANSQGDTQTQSEAYAIQQAVDTIAPMTMAPSAGRSVDSGMDMNTIALIAGIGLVAIGGIVILTRK